MGTTREEIRAWLTRAKEESEVTHVIIVCDTFDHEDYPVSVKKNEDVHERVKHYGTQMQRVMEVYAMALDLEQQLAEHRSFNYERPMDDDVLKIPVDFDIPTHDGIMGFVHCKTCLDERASSPSLSAKFTPGEYARLNVGFTKEGLQIWCVRHEKNVMHIHFQGHEHPWNTEGMNPVEPS
jgi:hypothetical protein